MTTTIENMGGIEITIDKQLLNWEKTARKWDETEQRQLKKQKKTIGYVRHNIFIRFCVISFARMCP